MWYSHSASSSPSIQPHTHTYFLSVKCSIHPKEEKTKRASEGNWEHRARMLADPVRSEARRERNRPQAAHTAYQLSSPSCATRAIQKSLTLNQKCLRTFWKKSQGNGPLATKLQDRNGKRTRQKNKRGDKKEESNDSPEIPQGVASDIPGLPSGQAYRNDATEQRNGRRDGIKLRAAEYRKWESETEGTNPKMNNAEDYNSYELVMAKRREVIREHRAKLTPQKKM